MKPKGLAIIIGKAKGDDEEEESSESSPEVESGDEKDYAELAFDAAKEDDKEAFTKSLLGAIRACIAKHEDEGYDDEE
jgi:hypothetical protein